MVYNREWHSDKKPMKNVSKQTTTVSLKRSGLCHFLTSGMTKGSLKLRLAAMVSTGSRQQNRAPNRIIFPMCGSTGNRAKWTPRGVNSSCLSKAFCKMRVYM